MITSGTGNCTNCRKFSKFGSGGFTLVELLVVVAIMGMVLAIVGLGINGMRSSNLEIAANQVANGLSLARQLAIANNSPAAFMIWTNTSGSQPNSPQKPYKYWAVAYSTNNKSSGDRSWMLYKDWEMLPEGVVFYDLRGGTTTTTYRTINDNPISDPINTPFIPTQYFTNNTYTLSGNTATILPNIPALEFEANGAGSGTIGASGIRLIDGIVDFDNNLVLRNTNRYYFVETDNLTGRIRVRPKESYR